MSRTLVVFHSRSGHTRRVAKALAERLEVDLDKFIAELQGRPQRAPRTAPRKRRATA